MNENMFIKMLIKNMPSIEENSQKPKFSYTKAFSLVFNKLSVLSLEEERDMLKFKLIQLAVDFRNEFSPESFEWYVLTDMIEEKKFKKSFIMKLAFSVDKSKGIESNSSKEELSNLKKEYNDLNLIFQAANDQVNILKTELNNAIEKKNVLYVKLRELNDKIKELSVH